MFKVKVIPWMMCIAAFAILMTLVIVQGNRHEEIVNNLLNELAAAHEFVYELQLIEEEYEIEEYEYEIEPYSHIVQHILEHAPAIVRELTGEDVELGSPEDFVMLLNNRILVNVTRYIGYHFGFESSEVVFRFWELEGGELQLELVSHGFGGWWLAGGESPNQWSWVRTHELELVPIRFYSPFTEWFQETEYTTEYIDGANFVEGLVYYAQMHLDRRVMDAWFAGRVLYINLHFDEPLRMGGGTFGEVMRHDTLVASMASVPGIDALVIMVGGRREAYFGGHGMAFSDIYLVNDLRLATQN